MFKSLDQSIFDDSTGLKLLEYLTQDGKRNAGPRGRKALFQKQISEATLDDFTVRNINIPETTPIVLRNKPLTRNQHSQDSTISVNKSSFKPNCASTPVVATTVSTPYRVSKKSVGVQKTPELYEHQEIPETPDNNAKKPAETVVPKTPGNSHTHLQKPATPAKSCGPVIVRVEVLPREATVVPVTPEVPEAQPIYPNLDNVQVQQSNLPPTPYVEPLPPILPAPQAVPLVAQGPIDSAPNVHLSTAAAPSTVTMAPETVPVTVTHAPQTVADPKTPVAQHRNSLRVVSPSRLLAIISPSRAIISPSRASIIPPPPGFQTHTDDPNLTEDDIPETQQAYGSPQEGVDGVASPTAQRLVNFKLHMSDCATRLPPDVILPRRSRRAVSQHDNNKHCKPSSGRSTNASEKAANKTTREDRTVVRGSTALEEGSIRRASEITIARDTRLSSIVVAGSTRKRKLHSMARELTPISSPQNHSIVGRLSSTVHIPTEVIESVEVNSIQDAQPPSNMEEEEQPVRRSLEKAADDAVFKIPALPVKKAYKKKAPAAAPGPKKDRPVQSQNDTTASNGDNTNSMRRSSRAPKPVTEILPFCMMGREPPAVQTRINYCPKFVDLYKQLMAAPKGKTKTKAKSTKKAVGSEKADKPGGEKAAKVLADVSNTRGQNSSVSGVSSKSHQSGASKAGKTSKASKSTKKTDSMALVKVVEQSENDNQNETPRTTKAHDQRRRQHNEVKSHASASPGHSTIMTYRDTFGGGHLPPSSSTGVEGSSVASASRVIISRIREADLSLGKVLRQEMSGGTLMTYADYSKGVIMLNTTKTSARVKKKPLILNIATGKVIVNLESEERAVRITEGDEILIPVGMRYSIENINDGQSVIMFTWE